MLLIIKYNLAINVIIFFKEVNMAVEASMYNPVNITDIPANVWTMHIFPKLNLQSQGNVRMTCKRFGIDQDIKDYFTAQLEAARSIRVDSIPLNPWIENVKVVPLTKRQINLITQDWIKLAKKSVVLLPVYVNGCCYSNPETYVPFVTVPISKGTSVKKICKIIKEYLGVGEHNFNIVFKDRGSLTLGNFDGLSSSDEKFSNLSSCICSNQLFMRKAFRRTAIEEHSAKKEHIKSV